MKRTLISLWLAPMFARAIEASPGAASPGEPIAGSAASSAEPASESGTAAASATSSAGTAGEAGNVSSPGTSTGSLDSPSLIPAAASTSLTDGLMEPATGVDQAALAASAEGKPDAGASTGAPGIAASTKPDTASLSTGVDAGNVDALAVDCNAASGTTSSVANAPAAADTKTTPDAAAGAAPIEHPALPHLRTLRQKLMSGEAMVMGDLLKLVDWIEAKL